jgi:hypothetical protein
MEIWGRISGPVHLGAGVPPVQPPSFGVAQRFSAAIDLWNESGFSRRGPVSPTHLRLTSAPASVMLPFIILVAIFNFW